MARLRRSRRANVIPPLTSMGDIAFLLIAFFILVSQFNKDVGKKYTPPQSEDIDVLKKPPVISIIVEQARNGRQTVWLGNEEVQSLEALEGMLASRVEGREGDSRRVILKADADTPQEVYQTILEAIAANSLPVAMSGNEEKPQKPKQRQ